MNYFNRICQFLARERIDEEILVVTFMFITSVVNIMDTKVPVQFSPMQFMYGDVTYGVFSEDRLADYNGIKEEKLYLAVLGSVFDVTKGAKYYAQGGSYHYFVGKDGSRALITGEFTDESENKDNVIDLSCVDLKNLLNWKATFQEKYDLVGVLKGRYYDKNGKETVYFKELFHRINQCEEDKKASLEQERKYPPCNIAWNPHEGSKVWCTKSSGGVTRDWIGVPRQLYTPGQEKPHCVCINLNTEKSLNQFKEYDGCSNTASICTVDSI